MDTEVISAIRDALIGLLALIILPALKDLIRLYVSKIQSEILLLKPDFSIDLDRAVDIGINAAEQLFLKHGLDKEQRLEYALSIVRKLLEYQGHDNFDTDMITAAVEAKLRHKNEK